MIQEAASTVSNASSAAEAESLPAWPELQALLKRVGQEPVAQGRSGEGLRGDGEVRLQDPGASAEPEGPWFPAINLRATRAAQSLQEVAADRHCKALAAVFADAGLSPQLGFNASSQTTTLNLTVPPLTGPDAPSAAPLAAPQLLVWVMLGIAPRQHEAEEAFLRARAGSEPPPAPPRAPRVLANLCLEAFQAESGVVVTAIARNLRLRTLKVAVSADYSKSKVEPQPYRYGPRYGAVLGWEGALEMSREVQQRQQAAAVASALAAFWAACGRQEYIVSPALAEQFSPILREFFTSGMQQEANAFRPTRNGSISLFLHGRAGIGKSRFVSVLHEALNCVLRGHFDSFAGVRVVKLPLSSVGADDLRSIATVRGISDMSIERCIEQHVCKGHLVVLHMEECPPDPAFQDQLFASVKAIQTALAKHYPDKVANVLQVVTSNHAPSQQLVEERRMAYVHLEGPSAPEQVAHCRAAVRRQLAAASAARPEVEVEWRDPPPAFPDMRMMHWWTLSFAFQLVRLLRPLQASPAVGEDGSIPLRLSIRSSGETAYEVAVLGEGIAPEVSAVRIEFDPASVLCWRGGESPGLEGGGAIPPDDLRKLQTIAEMFAEEYVHPLVVTIAGTSQDRKDAYRSALVGLARGARLALHETALALLQEGDQSKLTGEVSEIRGGLLKFMDDVNNENVPAPRLPEAAADPPARRFGLIQITANEVGQFMLREVLESDRSTSHRLSVSKQRLLFILDVPAPAPVSPQLLSRSIAVFTCD